MAFLQDLRLSADADYNCGYIKVTDISTYPIQTTLNRADIGIALFWSSDDFTSVLGYSMANTDDWWVNGANRTAFRLRAWTVNIWSASATYNAGTLGKIVYHVTKWYYQSLAAPSGTPGSVGTTGWALLEIGQTDPGPLGGGTIDNGLDLYTIFIDSLVTKTQDVGWGQLDIYTDCPLLSLIKTDCHKWTLVDNSSGTITVSGIYLKRWDQILLDDELVFSNSECDIDLSLYTKGDDGVYTVEVWGRESGETVDTLKGSVVIFDLCDSEECYKALFKFIICKCSDPCDQECQEQEDIYEKRYDIDMIFGLYHQITKYVYYDRFRYMGILTINENRSVFLSQVGRMIDKLKIITDRCGNCTSDNTNDITC